MTDKGNLMIFFSVKILTTINNKTLEVKRNVRQLWTTDTKDNFCTPLHPPN